MDGLIAPMSWNHRTHVEISKCPNDSQCVNGIDGDTPRLPKFLSDGRGQTINEISPKSIDLASCNYDPVSPQAARNFNYMT